MKKLNVVLNRMIAPSLGLGLVALSGCMVSSGTVRFTTYASGLEVVERPVTLESDNGEFANIYIENPAAGAPVQVTEGGNMLLVTANLSSDNQGSLETFSRSTGHDRRGRDLTIRIGGSMYQCSSSEINGMRSVVGVCIDSLMINLPMNSMTRVYINGSQVGMRGPMSLQDLHRGLSQRPFDNQRMELVRAYVGSNSQARERFAMIEDVMSVMQKMSFDDGKLEVARAFSGHVMDRRENSFRAAQVMTFDQHRLEVVELLQR